MFFLGKGGECTNGRMITVGLLPINRLTHIKTRTHTVPLSQIRLSEVEVYFEHLGEVKG